MNAQKSKDISPIKKAINLIGGQKAVGNACGITQQNVSCWIKRGIPPKYVLKIEKLTNGAVTRYDLRPDLYPKDE